MQVIGVILILICLVLAFNITYCFINENENIPTSLYYKKIARLQRDIEWLTERKKLLNPLKDGYAEKFVKIEKRIKAKKKEIKRVKVHIKIEDDAHKY